MTKKIVKQKITKNTLILEIVEKYPKLVEVLVDKYALHCIGCSMSAVETLEEGAAAHGLEKKVIEKMVNELNEIASKEGEGRKKK